MLVLLDSLIWSANIITKVSSSEQLNLSALLLISCWCAEVQTCDRRISAKCDEGHKYKQKGGNRKS